MSAAAAPHVHALAVATYYAALARQQEGTQVADVLDLVLAATLPSLHQRDVCALLCASTSTTAAVTRNSGFGRLAVSAALSTPAQSQALSRWLGTHSRLLRSLEVSERAGLRAPFGALPRLTGLRSLKLTLGADPAWGSDKVDGVAVAAALGPLTALTELELQGVSMPWQPLSEFPASLRRLIIQHIDGLDLSTRDDLELGHLTALTELDLGLQQAQVALRDGDVLPPKLVRLHGMWGGAVGALKGLSSLRRIGGRYSARQLVQFAAAGVTQLSHVGLTHGHLYWLDEEPEPDVSDEEDESGDWGLVDVVRRLTDARLADAVRDVELKGESEPWPSMSPALLDALKQLPVQSLQLVDTACRCRDLSVLTQLSRLDLSDLNEFAPDGYEFDYDALPDDLLTLPSLRELVVSKPGPHFGAAVAAAHDAFLARVAESRPQLRVVTASVAVDAAGGGA